METELTQEEIEAFNGLNESYIEMSESHAEIAPRCHFKPMAFDRGDGESYNNTWWECETCGHTKNII